MKRHEKFKKVVFFIKHYIFQCVLATAVIYLILLFLSLREAVVIASLGATAFIVFAMPKAVTANPRNVIGGQLVGLLCGSLTYLIPFPEFFHYSIVYATAVGLSMFIMVITDTEHPPAAGTALGVAMLGFSIEIGVAVIASVLVLSIIHNVFRGYLEDLT